MTEYNSEYYGKIVRPTKFYGNFLQCVKQSKGGNSNSTLNSKDEFVLIGLAKFCRVVMSYFQVILPSILFINIVYMYYINYCFMYLCTVILHVESLV